MTKVFDLAVKVGTYQKDGETKNRYKNVGSVMQGEHGQFLLLDKTFNPAGVMTDKDSVMISMFEPRVPNNNQSGGFKQKDDIPF